MLTREDDGEEEKMMNCLKSKERERQATIYGIEECILGEAEYHIRRPMPGITAGARPTLQHGAGGGPRGPQATGLMPAALGRWGLYATERHTSHRAKFRANKK
jgi:hypothetical protein